ncbi:MAG: glycosyl transferase [Rhodobacteraceae bacterium]|nr:glycosyl transferase [Paracoccaceae bacterium]
MSVGISLLLHQNFDRAEQLVRALLREGCKVAIHIDGKIAEDEFRDFQQSVLELPNVIFTRRVHCEWGTYSLVKAQLIVAREIIAKFPDVSHVVQLSGSCLPTRPISELVAFLEDNRGTDFIESILAGQSNWIKGGLEAERFTLYFPFSWRRQRKFFDYSVTLQRKLGIKRQMPVGLEAHVGSQWWALSRETLRAILDDPERKKNDKFFAKCWIPDESYFQTLVRKHGKRIESRSLTYSRFDLQGNPMLFYNDHLEYLEHLEGFFVRKVWQGADELYETLLAPDFTVGLRDPEMRMALAAQIERQEGRRNYGRAGLNMQSRAPKTVNNQSDSATKYTVLIGLDRGYPDVADWLTGQTGIQVHNQVFAPGHAGFANLAKFTKGNLTDHAKIRDYAPIDFLKNYLWNNRGSQIVFQFWSLKKAKVFSFIANDPNATVHYVRFAWVLDLLHENITNPSLLRERAQSYVAIDEKRIAMLESGCADLHVYSLNDVLNQPSLVLNKLIECLLPKSTSKPRELPEVCDWKGLENLANLLKNNGMNLDFELAANERPVWHEEGSAPVLIAE